ncbi:MAG TPA: PAS domain S-box protein [Mucilaginibacter sp.]
MQKNKTILIISLLTIIAGLVVMTGWIFDIPAFQSIVPGFEGMRFNAALCFVLFGVTLLITQYSIGKYNNLAFCTLSLMGFFIGLITLSQDLFHYNSGLDQLFVTDKTLASYRIPFPGRMAFNASFNFVLLGLGFLTLAFKKPLFNILSQFLFHIVTIFSAIALIGYLYGVSFFRALLYKTSMATHTAILFFIISLAASLLNPSIGIAGLFTGKRVGNFMARRLYSLIIIMVVVFGSLRFQTQYFHSFSAAGLGVSLLAIGFLLVSLLFIWHTANWLNGIDEQRTKAEAEIKLMNTDLERRVEERSVEFQKSEKKYRSLVEQASDAIYVLDHKRHFIDVNASMCKLVGYTREELLTLQVESIIDPEDLRANPLYSQTIELEQAIIRERRFLRKDGSVFIVEVNAKRFSDNRTMVIVRDITDRKKMEAELKEAELKFRTIAEKSMVGVYIVQDEMFSYVNPRFAEIFGYKPEDLINVPQPSKKIFHESYLEIVAENVRRRISGEVDTLRYEALGQKSDGTTNWVELYGNGVMIGGKPAIIGSAIDITKRKKAEEELRSSEQKYKVLFESNPLPLWMIAKDDLTVIAVNEAAANLYGYTKDELLNISVTALRPKVDLEQQMEGYQKRKNNSTDINIVRHLKKDGTIMFVQVTAHDIIFEGRPVRLSLTNDVTEKLKAEESLKKSEANLQAILNTTDTAYALFDIDLNVLAFNQKAIEFVNQQYGHNPEKGDRLVDFFPQDRFPQFISYTKNVLKGNNINFEIDYRQPDGSVFWYYVRLFPITDDKKEILGILIALYDITERKNAEQNLESAYERIQNQIESIKDMAWKQSHLVRSPLANLKGLAALLKDGFFDEKILDHIQSELDRMDSIIVEMAEEASDHDIS